MKVATPRDGTLANGEMAEVVSGPAPIPTGIARSEDIAEAFDDRPDRGRHARIIAELEG